MSGLDCLLKWGVFFECSLNKKYEQLDRVDFALADKSNIFFFQFPKGNAKEREELLQQLQKYPQSERFSMYLNIATIWLELILGNEK